MRTAVVAQLYHLAAILVKRHRANAVKKNAVAVGFKLKNKGELFGINEELSTYNNPVFEKKLGDGIIAEANRDGTTFVDSSVSDSKKKEAVDHENVHHEQMQQGRLDYTEDTVTWKKDTKSPARVYKRDQGTLIAMDSGKADAEGGDFEWEREAYKKS